MVEAIVWVLLGVIHALPALAFLRPSLLTSLYGVDPGTTTFVLLHHRAALFVGVLVACLWAAVDPSVRQLVTVATGISMLTFLLLYIRAGSPPPLRSIAVADLIGLPLLLFAGSAAFGLI